jgi:hypothetical protein
MKRNMSLLNLEDSLFLKCLVFLKCLLENLEEILTSRAVTEYFGIGTGTLEIGKFSVILNKIGNPTEKV